MRVLVTGAAGQLGGAIVQRFRRAHDVLPLTRTELDVTREADVARLVASERPGLIINCTAYNDVDGAEDHAREAFDGNAFAVLALARAARNVSATLVHYGTDFVFDGLADCPYTEDDAARPASVYGMSKLLGEWFAADAHSHYVLRVESLFGGPRAKSSVDRIIDAISGGEPVRVFSDRTVTPSYVNDVAEATELLLGLRPAAGLYHCVNSGMTTWLGLAQEVERLLDRRADLQPLSVGAVAMKARRPQYCALSNQKLADAGIPMPSWQDAVARYIATRTATPAGGPSGLRDER
jgi:dTDP-4-dehydrorhamnose reductase